MAARWLKARHVSADLIYVDAGHEEPDVYADLVNYYDLLGSGGVMLGDDWGWQPDVPNAVRRFARREYPLRVDIVENETMWLLRKRRSWRDRIKRVLGR
jgi:predicted O-methyltransferase YrrM